MPRRVRNIEVFAGSEHIVRRLRAAKRPEILLPLEIPPEELDLEPETIDPDQRPVPAADDDDIDDLPSLPLFHPLPPPARPAQLAAHEILPDDEDD